MFWLPWVFVAVLGLFLQSKSGDCASLWCTGFPLPWLLLQGTGYRPQAQEVWTHRLNCSAACEVFLSHG